MIEAGTHVRGYLYRTDGKHVHFAGEVIETYSAVLAGFLVPAVKVRRKDTGRIASCLAGDVEEIETRS